jgi:EAL domain-containing protein (putative c-di-GMP-specific phosphodiesterase class I)
MGKLLQPQNMLTARGSGTAPGGAEPLSAESLGWQLRAALPPLRLHSVSIYDSQGNVLWLSEGALGPDEHALVLEALEVLHGDHARTGCENGLEDGRAAVCLPVRAPHGQLVGLALILADWKSGGERLLERIMSVPLRTVMQKLAVLLRPAGPRRPDSDPTALVLSLTEDVVSSPAAEPPTLSPAAAAPPPAPPAARGRTGGPGELTPNAVDDILAVEARTASGAAAVGASGAARVLPPDAGPIALELLPYVRLRAGGRTRRFEVLPRATARELRDPAMLDSLTVEQLLAWLAGHRHDWTQESTSFTLNLSISTLEDERFPRRLAAALAANAMSPETLGFEIAEPLCTQRRAQVERFIGHCERLGCFVVIDDFSLDSAVLPLLRSKALRLVKIDARLTAGALRDKLSQALVVAIVQAVKVLGMHCAAQQVDSQAALQWLTAVGCDLAQGPMMAGSHPLERLQGAPVTP